jgi:hypothetical protein
VAQVFSPRANGIVRLVFFAGAMVVALSAAASVLVIRSSAYTGTDRPVLQPVPFSHQHHAGELGIDCRYCHDSVEHSASAGLPPTEVCMTCHSQIWTNAAMLAPVRRSLASGAPLRWNRVNDLGDFVYFNHSIHVNKGIGCVTCHGQVDEMPLTWRQNPMQMSWCLGCHRDPEPNLRPPEAVFDPQWRPQGDVAALRQALMRSYHINTGTMTDCYVCHR